MSSEAPPPSAGRAGGGGSGGGRGRRKPGGRGGRGGGRSGSSAGSQKPSSDAAAGVTTQMASVSLQPRKNTPKSDNTGNRQRRRGGKSGAAQQPAMTEEDKKRADEAQRLKQEAAEAEEERKRQEEAQKIAEAAKELRRKQHAELQKRVQEACDSLAVVVDTTLQHKSSRESLTAESLAKARHEFEANKKGLKSDLKKCTAFVKKIKSGGAWSLRPDEITRDVATLNLSRYVEEVASALTEVKLKLADLPVVIALCRAMHTRYAEFLPALMPALWSTIQGKVTDETAKLRRLYLRLITEFLLHGFVTETKLLVKTVSEATGGADGSYAVADAHLVVSFVKAAGFEILGTQPRSILQEMELLKQEIKRAESLFVEFSQEDEESQRRDEGPVVISADLVERAKDVLQQVKAALNERAVPPQVTEILSTHCLGAYQTLANSWMSTHAKLQKLEKRCEQDRLLSGSLPEVREKGLLNARKLQESLQKSVEVLSDILVQPLPELEEQNEEVSPLGTGVGVELWTKVAGEDGGDGYFGPFDDEETRSFYCDVPDLLTTIPPALLGMTQEDIVRVQAVNSQKYGMGFESVQELEEGDSAEVAPSSEADLDAEEAAERDGEVKDKEGDAAGDENKDTPHYRLMVLLEQELPECTRREQVDEVAEKFCVNHGASRNARKRMSKALFLVPRTRLDLLPYYSRLATVLDRVFPDVAAPLIIDLEQQFHGQAKFKKNFNMEGRLKTARYLGELTKFRVAPPIVALRCLKRCLDDFTGFNIDVACCLLESCGRYLYRTKHAAARVAALMDTMMRLCKAKNLDDRAQALINSAFYMVKPPASTPRKPAKVYPPLEAYLRHLLLSRLVPDEASISFISKQLLRFPWNDPSQQCGSLICKYMMKACRKGRYNAITAVASVASILRRSKPEVAARLVDAVLEELHWSMEHPNFRDQQRTITYSKLLGELYCFSLVTGHIVLQELHHFVNLGHDIPDALREASEKLASSESVGDETKQVDGSQESQQLPVYYSAGGISQTINEDDEMEETALETTAELPQPKAVAVSRHSKYDPRVPSPLDPPNSVFRIKLICTLLDSAGKALVTRNNMSGLEAFLAAFQRYLFTKTVLPTEVEFSLLDTFDTIDSRWKGIAKDATKGKKAESSTTETGFTRYASWLEAHNATVALEEAEAAMESKTRARLEALTGVSQSADGNEGSIDGSLLNDDELDSAEQFMMDEDDESTEDPLSLSIADDTLSEMESEDEEESGSESEDESQGEDVSDEESSEASHDSEEDLEDDDVSEEEELDEEAYMRQLEAEAFERELRRVTMEALEKGKSAARTGTGGKVADYMPSGSQFIKKKPADLNKTSEVSSSSTLALGGKEGITFQLLRKGNKGKVESKELIVPSDTNLAKLATKQDDEAARERDILKARVLQYEAESAEQHQSGGNVYIEQAKLQVIRNRPLSMEDIDRNFGSTRGEGIRKPGPSEIRPRSQPSSTGRGGRTGGRGRGGSGRSLYF